MAAETDESLCNRVYVVGTDRKWSKVRCGGTAVIFPIWEAALQECNMLLGNAVYGSETSVEFAGRVMRRSHLDL